MPTIDLKIPANSRFHSSLNEIDLAMKQIFLHVMRIADPRDKSGIQDNTTEEENNYLWDDTRVFQVDELDTEEIFNTYLLRKKINNTKGVDISYPLLAYLQNDIDTVFWGTGNRFHQWYLDLPVDTVNWEVGDIVGIAEVGPWMGLQGEVAETVSVDEQLYCKLMINGSLAMDPDPKNKLKKISHLFNIKDLRALGDKTPQRYKAKSITGTYSTTVLVDNRDEAQYLRDKFILRCADAKIWFKYNSPTIANTENQIFTVFDIPNIGKYPTSQDKLKGIGYIYGITFNTHIWGCLTDEPLPQGWIDTIRMNIEVEREGRVNRIVIN